MTHSKYKRLLAGLLSVVMTCSMFAPAVNAAGEPAAAPAAGAQEYGYEEIPRNQMKDFQASSFHSGNNQEISKAFDGNNGTEWHTRWDSGYNATKHWIEWKVGDQPVLVGRLGYIRKAGVRRDISGVWKNIEVLGKNGADAQYETICTMSDMPWLPDNDEVSIEFPNPMLVTHLKVQINNTIGAEFDANNPNHKKDDKYASAGEIITYKAVSAIEGNYRRLPKQAITHFETDSEQGDSNYGFVKYAFDDNLRSHWHSCYNTGTAAQNTLPHYVEWTLDRARWIGQIEYDARTNSNNGRWKKIKVEGKNDTGDWIELATKNGIESTDTKVKITFTPHLLTDLKVTIEESYGDTVNKYATAAEIRTYEYLPDISGVSVNLGNSLALRFGIDKTLLPADTTGITAKFTRTYNDNPHKKPDNQKYPLNQVTEDVALKEDADNNRYYVEYENIAAKEMGDQVTVQLFKNGVPISTPYTSSVKDYATTVLGMEDAQLEKIADGKDINKLRTVVTDMLNYGAEAQKFFKYDEENLVNVGINQDLATQTITPSVALQDTHYGTSLTLESNILMNVYFKMADPAAKPTSATVSYTHHGGDKINYPTAEIKTYTKNPDMYSVTVDGLAVADYQQSVTVTVTGTDGNSVTHTTTMAEYLTQMKESYPNEMIYSTMEKFCNSSLAYFTSSSNG